MASHHIIMVVLATHTHTHTDNSRDEFVSSWGTLNEVFSTLDSGEAEIVHRCLPTVHVVCACVHVCVCSWVFVCACVCHTCHVDGEVCRCNRNTILA